jgi:hypothetical protein
MQIRLFDWQIEYLKRNGNGCKILSEAFGRYSDGKIPKNVVQIAEKRKNKQKVPQILPFSVKKRFPVSDSAMRAILKYHIETPDTEQIEAFKLEKEKLDKEIESEMKLLSGVIFLEK